MYRVIACLTQEHTFGLVAVAAFVCVLGSVITVLLNRRLIKTTGRRQQIQLILTSVIAGATIWSTHFIAMLAYDPGVPHGYDTTLTFLSLIIAVAGLVFSHWALVKLRVKRASVVSGAIFGLTVSAMHFVGMSAYLLPATLVWDWTMVASSVILGMVFGAAAHHRVLHPVTRYCWLGGAVAMVLAICTMHFTGMAAFEVMLDGSIAVPAQVIPDDVLAILIISVTLVILLIGLASVTIETDVQRQANSQLRYAKMHDPLTGLPNRMRLDQEIETLQRRSTTARNKRVAVLTINLNAFKEINDLYGHNIGDQTLREVAERLSNAQHSDEFIARTAGDEFVVLKQGFQRIEVVYACAERLLASIVEPIDCAGHPTFLSAAIGISSSETDGHDLHLLLQKSGLAMYRAKTERDAHICAFHAETDRLSQDRLMLTNDLRGAVSQGQLELVYQYQNDINSRDIIGFEALLRWNHPTRGSVSPSVFIPIAEETGLIREIGLWVLRTACAEAASWDRPYSVAVNVAPQQLIQPSFQHQVTEILQETGLSPDRLELEITEASIIDDETYALEVMKTLQAMGIHIAMDDFGTGYSSLAMLQAFPFNKIKIDRSFVQNIHKDEKRAAIVRATLLLAKAFDIPVLAEGVELEEELAFLSDIKCNSVQGFYFGKPMQIADLHQSIGIAPKQIAS